ncbi:hypothetical protein I6B53_06950 [Schaalia sp. 19OD2882]|uniref:hypothetical protein n=1 Tax=Schaalia sp. 19OD2882 TaxID=2794089 RepID=UPI001C1F022D|nr:hypothetical protein [Schaalia sp. 19OD2882]QWW18885.1 hypothetical protein I6B53_06950 [Schaalia sp. 19OD2882]
MSDPSFFSQFMSTWTGHPLTWVVGVLGFLYGISFAVGGAWGWREGPPQWFIFGGAGAVFVVFLISLVIAWLKMGGN